MKPLDHLQPDARRANAVHRKTRNPRPAKPRQLSRAAGSVLSYTDIDGDNVRIATSAGNLAGHATIVGGQLRLLDLSDPSFNGANITFTVTRAGNGDGLAAVGRIVGGSNDFGAIVVRGDLGAITAGSGSATVPAIQSLRVRSMGSYGLATQGGAGDLRSSLNGALGALHVASDVKEAILFAAGTIGPVNIGGSLLGGAVDQSGSITARDGLGLVTIGGSIVGGGGVTSGAVACTQNVAGVTVGGSVLGGSGFTSGVIFSAQGATGPVKIGGNLVAGTATFTGRVFGRSSLASVTVGGSLIGGPLNDSGRIHTDGDLGPVSIGHDVKGGASLRSGFIDSAGKIGAITIGGSLVGGSGGDCGAIFGLGDMSAVRIEHNVQGGAGFGSARIFSGGKLPSVTIGGSLSGGTGDVSGMIFAGGDLGALKIGGDVLGGAGPASAMVECHAKVASVSIGGSLLGGAGGNSARIASNGDMGTVKIAHDVRGQAIFSGLIQCGGKLAGVIIGGSLIGGPGKSSGIISSIGDIAAIRIGQDLAGGNISGSDPSLDRSGFIESLEGRIVSVTIGGSVRAGTDNSTAGLYRNASISAGHDIGAIVIAGSVAGSVGASGDVTRVVFTARGQVTPAATKDLAIGKLTVGGRAERMSVLAGFASNLLPLNGNAQIGPISIGGDLVASSLVAGVRDVNGDGFGNADDRIIGNLPNSIARIASVVIGGVVIGTASGFDHFGIESHVIGSLTINGFVVPIVSPLSLSPLTGSDVAVRIV